MARTLAHRPGHPGTRITAARSTAARTTAALVTVAVAALTGCSAIGTDNTPKADASASSSGGGKVVLVTHDSFALSKDLIAQFEKDTGLTLEQRAPGDGGELVNQLILTKDAPLGDVVFGIDNTFASRAIDEGVLEPYASPALPAGADTYAVDGKSSLTPVDVGDVCLNVDHEWFAEKGLAEPTSFEDLAAPAYKDLLVVTNPATSSPGLAFLLATIAKFGEDGWKDYWTSLRANGLKVDAGWEDAYYSDFSGPSSEGDRPIVLSYASSPPYEVPDGGTTAPTGALLDTCFRQVEYAGVLAGAKNPEGARKVVDWLLSHDVQADIPESMYVYPVDASVALPASWTTFAPQPAHPATLDPAVITKNRDAWIQQWTDVVIG
ncbi:MAG TPA: thiamine ABC transporter substrate-binding protein [Actinotalea sp.]